MSKARFLLLAALFLLPTFALADSDPQMDPNDCTGSFSLAPAITGGGFSLFTDRTNTNIAFSFTALDASNLSNSQPSSCVANNTGGVITSMSVSTPEVPGDTNVADYTCPTATCTVSIDNGIVTYDFTGLNIAAGSEFGFIDTGFSADNIYSLANFDPTDPNNERAVFDFAAPEPGTLALLATGIFPVWASLRRRKKVVTSQCRV